MENCIKKITCRLCGSSALEMVLDLGNMPLANAFLSKEDLKKEEACFPLAVNFCHHCFSVQLSHTVNGNLLFKNYHYVTSASKPLAEHFYTLADEIFENYIQSPKDLVVEIGSNDGCLLSRLKGKCRILGIDPAENVTIVAKSEKIPTVTDFFTLDLVKKIKPKIGPARVVVANNVMAHIDDLRDVFSGVKEFLSDDGYFIFEVHWVGNLLTEGGFDQIYHEHLFYHSLHSLKNLIESLGMVLIDVKTIPIHGESLRVYAGNPPAGGGKSSPAVENFLKREIEMGLTKSETFVNFSKKIETNKKKLTELLHGLKAEGKKIFGYGAPAKGNTLLNYFHIGPDILEYVTDTTLSKQSTYTPGMHIRVVSPEMLIKEQPDFVLLLSWNYADAILEKEKELRNKGVKFIIPVPQVRIV
jgi:hypothetical protein